MINFGGDPNTRQDSRKERIQGAMYISPTRKNSVVPSRIKKSFSLAVYIFHAIFQNPSFLSLAADVHSLIHSWTNREDPQDPPGWRSEVIGACNPHPNQEALPLAPSREFHRPFSSREKNEEREVRPKKKETEWCMCLDIRCTLDRGESIDARYNINAVIIRRHI